MPLIQNPGSGFSRCRSGGWGLPCWLGWGGSLLTCSHSSLLDRREAICCGAKCHPGHGRRCGVAVDCAGSLVPCGATAGVGGGLVGVIGVSTFRNVLKGVPEPVEGSSISLLFSLSRPGSVSICCSLQSPCILAETESSLLLGWLFPSSPAVGLHSNSHPEPTGSPGANALHHPHNTGPIS